MPTLSYPEVNELLCGPGQRLEIEVVDIRGVPTRTRKHAARSLVEVLAQGRAKGEGRNLFRLDDERLTHDEHYLRVAALARAFVEELGVRKGDWVAIAMRNYPEWSVAFFAAAVAGAVAVPLSPFWNGNELAFAARDSGATILVADAERLERLTPDRPGRSCRRRLRSGDW